MPILSASRKPNSPLASLAPHHVGFRVPDLDAALDWYTEKLELRLVGKSEANGMTFCLLALPDDDTFRLELLHGPGAAPRPEIADDLVGGLSVDGFNHVGLQVADVGQTVAELKCRGVKVLLEPFDNLELQLRVAFVTDPWGNVIELLEPRRM